MPLLYPEPTHLVGGWDKGKLSLWSHRFEGLYTELLGNLEQEILAHTERVEH